MLNVVEVEVCDESVDECVAIGPGKGGWETHVRGMENILTDGEMWCGDAFSRHD